jgi:hypothetical protein
MLLTSILTDPSTRKYAQYDLPVTASASVSAQEAAADEPTIWSASQWSRIAEVGDAEVRAAQKIADAKEQLEFLRRSGFPAEVIARLAQELAHTVQAASNEYSAATSGDVPSAPVAGASAGTATVADAPSADLSDTTSTLQDSAVDQGDASDTERVAKVVDAYKNVMDDGDQFNALTDTSTTEAKFKSLLEEIKALIAKSQQQASQDKSDERIAVE